MRCGPHRHVCAMAECKTSRVSFPVHNIHDVCHDASYEFAMALCNRARPAPVPWRHDAFLKVEISTANTARLLWIQERPPRLVDVASGDGTLLADLLALDGDKIEVMGLACHLVCGGEVLAHHHLAKHLCHTVAVAGIRLRMAASVTRMHAGHHRHDTANT